MGKYLLRLTVVRGLRPSSYIGTYSEYGVVQRRANMIFADWLNFERGGLNLWGGKYAVQYDYVDDASERTQAAMRPLCNRRQYSCSTPTQCAHDGAIHPLLYMAFAVPLDHV
eukprot:6203046-Pleurochrysis_carterae.AAC.2